MSKYVYVRLTRPEGYEDIHPDLVIADAALNPAFEPEEWKAGRADLAQPSQVVDALRKIPTRIEPLGGQRTKYIQLDEAIAAIENIAAAPTPPQPSSCPHCESKQAEIDALMMEYCPSEMTSCQLANWASHQKPSGCNDIGACGCKTPCDEVAQQQITDAEVEELFRAHWDTVLKHNMFSYTEAHDLCWKTWLAALRYEYAPTDKQPSPQQVAQTFDEWQASPYTKILETSIRNDYEPKGQSQVEQVWTDEELISVADECITWNYSQKRIITFARAILSGKPTQDKETQK